MLALLLTLMHSVLPLRLGSKASLPVDSPSLGRGFYFDEIGFEDWHGSRPRIMDRARKDTTAASIPPPRYAHSSPRLPAGPEPRAGTPQAMFKDLVFRPASRGANTADNPVPSAASGRGTAKMGSSAALPPNPLARTNQGRRKGNQGGLPPGPVERLSSECQKRGFNPHWVC